MIPENLHQHAAFAAALFLLSTALTWLARRWLRVMDVPNGRSSHAVPTPRSGGVAIVVTVSLAVAAHQWLGEESLLAPDIMVRFLIAFALMVVMAVVDDARPLGVRGKLAVQVVAAVLVVSTGFWVRTLDVPLMGSVDLGWLGMGLTVVWLVAMTNAFNFMDGLDGLAAGQAVIAGAFLAAITVLEGSHFVFVVAYAMAAASAGFLVHNMQPARIFMGDTGSQFLGFAFALLAIVASQLDFRETTIMVVPVLFFSFLWDTGFTLIRRALAGQPIAAHRTHLYQLVNRLGASHRQVSLLYYGFAVLQGGLALLMQQLGGLSGFAVLAGLAVVHALYAAIVVGKARRAGLI